MLFFGILNSENPRKNQVLTEIAKNHDGLTELKTDSLGNQIRVLKDGSVTWRFDENRVLEVTIPSLTAIQKNALQGFANTRFGSGKVRIN